LFSDCERVLGTLKKDWLTAQTEEIDILASGSAMVHRHFLFDKRICFIKAVNEVDLEELFPREEARPKKEDDDSDDESESEEEQISPGDKKYGIRTNEYQ
jgi:hypothetical protein